MLQIENLVHTDCVDRGLRHARRFRRSRVLDDCIAALFFDSYKSFCPICVGSRKHYADQAWAKSIGGAFEQRIDGGPAKIDLLVE